MTPPRKLPSLDFRHQLLSCLLMVTPSVALAQSHSVPPERPKQDSAPRGQSEGKGSGRDSNESKSTPKNDSPPKNKSKPKDNAPPKTGDPRDGKKRLDPKPLPKDPEPSRGRRGSSRPYRDSNGGDDAEAIRENSAWRVALSLNLGGHLTIPGPSLRETSSRYGGGIDLFVGVGPRKIPLLFGAQFGVDFFDTKTLRFTYDGQNTAWDLDRSALWILGALRLTPTEGRLRPHLDLLGGAWSHGVSIDEDNVVANDESENLSSSTTFAYGAAAGLDVLLTDTISVGFSAMHLRGGSITVLNTDDLAVVDDVLYYGEARARSIYQWTFMLRVGGHF